MACLIKNQAQYYIDRQRIDTANSLGVMPVLNDEQEAAS